MELFAQEAKETLCDPERRANYDKWRNSGIAMSYKNWVGMKEHVGQVRRYTIAEKVDQEVRPSFVQLDSPLQAILHSLTFL